MSIGPPGAVPAIAFFNYGLLQEGRIYISDFKPLTEGAAFNPDPTTKQPLFAPLAIGLFHSTKDGCFNPIAIQLTPDDAESIFSPNDSEDDWLLAKMYFQAAKTSVHEVIFILSMCFMIYAVLM